MGFHVQSIFPVHEPQQNGHNGSMALHVPGVPVVVRLGHGGGPNMAPVNGAGGPGKPPEHVQAQP